MTHRVFKYLHEKGIGPCILLRSSAKIGGKITRDRVVRLVRKDKRACSAGEWL